MKHVPVPLVWVPPGAADQEAVVKGVWLRVHRVSVIGQDGQKRLAGWDGYIDGRKVARRWHTELAAKRAVASRAGTWVAR